MRHTQIFSGIFYPYKPHGKLFFHKHLILLLFSLCIPHTHADSDGCVRVYVWTVSLHSALNEPIMGVYVALMRVSVRRETLHRSPPNQWGLACYTTTCFLSSSSSLITSLLLLCHTPTPFSASLTLPFFLHSISERWEWGFWPIGHEESFKRSKMRPSESCYAQYNECKS